MAKNKTLVIDLNTWTVPSQLAVEKKTTPQYLSRLIKDGKIEAWRINELRLTLVKRKNK